MGTGFRPLPILPKNPLRLESWPGKLARFRRVPWVEIVSIPMGCLANGLFGLVNFLFWQGWEGGDIEFRLGQPTPNPSQEGDRNI
jgi:hypothetical protein